MQVTEKKGLQKNLREEDRAEKGDLYVGNEKTGLGSSHALVKVVREAGNVPAWWGEERPTWWGRGDSLRDRGAASVQHKGGKILGRRTTC